MDFLGDFLYRKWTFGENIDNFGVQTPRTYHVPLDCFQVDGGAGGFPSKATPVERAPVTVSVAPVHNHHILPCHSGVLMGSALVADSLG